MTDLTSAPWCVPEGSEIVVCQDGDRNGPGKILFIVRGPQGTRESYPYELLAEYAAHIVQAVNAVPELIAALEGVRKIISDGAMTGFNCHDGDWAERLFESQRGTSAALKTARGRSVISDVRGSNG